MEEKYYLFDILANEKQLVANTAIALNEASCDNIHNKYFKILTSLTEIQKDLFAFAFDNNWYQLEDAKESKIQDEITKFEDELENVTMSN